MAWTEITRQQYRREALRYASDLTDAEWALIEPFLPAPAKVGRPRKTDLRKLVEAILYMASTGCQWRAIPKKFPPCSTVQGYFYAWSRRGVLKQINHVLVMGVTRETRPGSQSDGWRHRQPVGEEPLRPAVPEASMPARRSKAVSDISSPILKATSSACRSIPPMSRIATEPSISWPRSVRSIRGSATSSPTAAMAATNCATAWPAWGHGPSRSSSDPIPHKALNSCLVAGWSSGRSPGSDVAAASPRTSRPPLKVPWLGFSSPTSAGSHADSSERKT